MTIEQIKEMVRTDQYEFLRTNPHLKGRIILLGLGGSHAYGTNVEGSDVDIRGCVLNSKEEILTNQNFECFENTDTDTVVYSFNKLISLLSSCNPNVIELLGLKPEHYLVMTSIGKELLDNRRLFLTKRAIHSFGGYANAQLRRLDNKAARLVGQAEREQHILNSINNAFYTFPQKYFPFGNANCIKLYLDDAVQEDFDKEIFMDVHLEHYPLRDYKSMWSEMNNIVRDYAKVGRRNANAIEHGKIAKHMMHLVRLYLMCFDILEKEEIITYRFEDHDFLMSIRNGKYLDDNDQPTEEFYQIVSDFEKRLEYDKEHTNLPDKPDFHKINDFVMSVNERIVKENVGRVEAIS